MRENSNYFDTLGEYDGRWDILMKEGMDLCASDLSDSWCFC